LLVSIAVDPMVVTRGATSRLLVTVNDAGGPTLQLGLQPGTDLLRFGERVEELLLRDDGTQGDEVAGDGVFTVDGLSPPIGPTGIGSTTLGTVTLAAQAGESTLGIVARPRLSVRAMDTALIARPVIDTVSYEDMQLTSRLAVIVTDTLDFTGTAKGEVVGRFYEAFADDRDWLVVMRAPTSEEAFDGQAIRLGNTIGGIGMSPIDARSSFGSAGRLDLVVELVRDFYWPRGEFDGAFCLLTHELAHRWAAELGQPLASGSHWAAAFRRSQSALGHEGKCRFNRLELYLAGRLPADSVPEALTDSGMTIGDLVATHGRRRPTASRDNYRIGFIVVTPRPLSPTEITYFHHLAGEYAAPESPLGLTFEGATGGRIRLDGVLTPRGGLTAN
jgi:hypothetical protein